LPQSNRRLGTRYLLATRAGFGRGTIIEMKSVCTDATGREKDSARFSAPV
jgi:hypothetical protein